MRQRRGVTLLFSLGVLAVLSMLAVSFVRLVALEREAGRQHLLEVRAREMAAAGVRFAVARLRELAAAASYDTPDAPWIYRGEDLDGNGALDRSEDVFAPERGELDGRDCPLALALAPSLAHPDNAARLARGLPAASGVRPTASGSFSEEGAPAFYLAGGGAGAPAGWFDASFTLRVLDCASMIDVNGGRIAGRATPDAEYQAVVAGMIDRLWGAMRAESGLGAAYDLAGLGGLLVGWPETKGWRGGFATTADLEQALREIAGGGAVAAETWRRVGPYLTCTAWRDPTVIRPAPPSGTTIAGARRLTALERLPRAPINVNTADWKVIYAVLSGLAGVRWRTALAAEVASGALYAPDRLERIEIDDATARDVARRLAAWRLDPSSGKVRPFRNAADLDVFLDSLVATGRLTRLQVELIQAQAHPDTQLEQLDPDAAARRALDKADLVAYRTEFCFSAMGYFRIASLGRVSWERYALAEAGVETTVRVYDVLRETTYAEFERGTTAGSALRPGVSALAGAGPAYDGRVGLAPIDPVPARPYRFRLSPTAPGDCDHGGLRFPLQSALVGPSPQGTRTAGGVFSDAGHPGGTHPCYARAGAAGERYDEQRGGLCWWFKPAWPIAAKTALRAHSILDFNGPAADTTFQLYWVGGADPVAPRLVPFKVSGPRLVLLAWDARNRREGRVELPLTDRDGEPLCGPGEWMHLSLMWDSTKVVATVRGRYKDPGLVPPAILDDSSGGGGPISLVQQIVGGVVGVIYWVTDGEKKKLPDELKGPLTGAPAARPAYIKLGTLRLGGPLKARPATTGEGPLPPAYRGPYLAPARGTYANLVSLTRPDIDLTLQDPLGLLGDPDSLLSAIDPDYREVERLYRLGRYRNGDGFGGATPFGRFESRTLTETAGLPLGTIDWRGQLPAGCSLAVRILRKRGAGWEEAPDPADPARPLSFSTPGRCAIGREIVDRGAVRPLGALRYRVYLVESTAAGRPLLEGPQLDSVTLTLLGEPVYLDWRWR